ncbi:unnamed protein product [Gadus morhua 'NCC']
MKTTGYHVTRQGVHGSSYTSESMAKPGAGHPQGSGKENSNTLTRRGGEEVQQHQAGEILRGGAEPSYCCHTSTVRSTTVCMLRSMS